MSIHSCENNGKFTMEASTEVSSRYQYDKIFHYPNNLGIISTYLKQIKLFTFVVILGE